MEKVTVEELASSIRTLSKVYRAADSTEVAGDVLLAFSHLIQILKEKTSLPEGAQIRRLPFSEVCISMKVAGTFMWVVPLVDNRAQLYTLEGEKFSFPITHGEAGLLDREGVPLP